VLICEYFAWNLRFRRHYESHNSSPGGSTDLMMRVIDWLPRMWQHVNRFIESRCGVGTDVTIGKLDHLR